MQRKINKIAPKVRRWVYGFGGGAADGDASMGDLLGGKGANLAEMSALGLPVPPGFTVSTEVCAHCDANGGAYPDGLEEEVAAALARVEALAGARFGDPENPLPVSVRSGARASMPGMMDTVLNLGLNDATAAGLAARTGDARFAWDSYRRFVQMYAEVVLGADRYRFEDLLALAREEKGAALDTELDAGDLRRLVAAFKAAAREEVGRDFPDDPREQLWGAIGAVLRSWRGERAVTYRRLHDIPDAWGTAVNIQAMVFGNMGADCATGVAFTRDPSTGENRFYGEFLANAQGEDVVSGVRTPPPLAAAAAGPDGVSMEAAMPDAFRQLVETGRRLEAHYRDMQDIEFTVQRGRLYMLQTRAGKRAPAAAIRIAVEMAEAGTIGREEALLRVDPGALDGLLHPVIDPAAERRPIATGLPASPGAVGGAAVFSAGEAERRAAAGEAVILVRRETSPEDIHGMYAARGVLTARGGMTSHAAVVARGMGRPCVCGAGRIRVDAEARRFEVAGVTVEEGDWITIDGAAGQVMPGRVATLEPELSGEFATLMAWADGARRMGVRANAETAQDARKAREFGAEGIGLCRTEHMFFEAERIAAAREMILADGEERRRAALAKILPMQRADFAELFRAMDGRPVTIRLLDPPLHEFLPQDDGELAEMARAMGFSAEAAARRARELREANPMLGHRGCRLAISHPEIAETQARAIFEAAAAVAAEGGPAPVPEVMVPLAATGAEVEILKALVDRTAAAVAAETGARIDYLVGAMIELPRAALRAGEIAGPAAFFSFGTNDLTQTAFGVSRDDAGAFLRVYRERGILEKDPFVTLDADGVGELVTAGVERGRAARPDLKIGICGEHGGDPASIEFCERAGLDYVSCSPYRVPIARLAAAQAAIRARG